MQTKYMTITNREARAKGYVPVTSAYYREEWHLLDKAIVDLDGTDYKLVAYNRYGIMIYRKKAEVKLDRSKRYL